MNPLRRFATAADQMKCPHRYLASAIVAASACLTLLPLSSSAAIIINVSEVGSDVVAVATGSANTSALSFQFNIPANAFIDPSNGNLLVGPASSTNFGWYNGASGPVALGNGSSTAASFGSGDGIGVLGSATIFLPTTPKASYAGSSTWAGTTLAQLGLNEGTYTWNWGAGANADSLTINVVPEPSTSAMALAGLACGGYSMWRRRKSPCPQGSRPSYRLDQDFQGRPNPTRGEQVANWGISTRHQIERSDRKKGTQL